MSNPSKPHVKALDTAYDAYKADPVANEDAFYKALYSYVRKHPSKIQGEDAVQEAVIHLWEVLPKFKGDSLFSTWAHTTIHNALLDEVRKDVARADVEVSLEALLENGGERHLGASSMLDPEELVLVEEALQSLPPREAEIVKLMREGYNEVQVGEMLGIDQSNVSRGWERALRRLQSR